MTDESASFHHISVLPQTLIDGIQIVEGGHYLDVTVGGGGHSELILQAFANTTLVAIDRDQQALEAAQTRLEHFCDPQRPVTDQRVQFWHGNFADYDPGTTRFDGIIADLGVSSVQLDRPERGFSFRQDAPLDMRMDQAQHRTAADIINTTSEKKLADIFFHYGEERYSRRIARQIVAQRPFHRTDELATVVARAMPHPKGARRSRIHPATRVFQSLRIVVNQELSSLETLIQKAPDWLKLGGIIGIISFHSLEDRIVKHQFRGAPGLKVLTKKPILPTETETQANPRARSAKLRFAQRIECPPADKWQQKGY